MSIRRQDGARADTSEHRKGDLTPVEVAYIANRPERMKHLAVVALRYGHNYKFSVIADLLNINDGYACRLARDVPARLAAIGKRINYEPARRTSPDDDDDDN